MPKFPTYPTLFDDVLQIDISKLKEWGYLNPEQTKSCTITWSSNGNITGNISIKVKPHNEQPYIELDYNYRDESRNYKISLVSVPSNLGKGVVWYFLCPQTNKRCRKLYSIDGYFLHREAFKGCMYESQTHSKRFRQMDKTFGAYFKTDEHYSQLNQKHFKRTYAGKPTKKFLRLEKQIQQAEKITYLEFEKALLC